MKKLPLFEAKPELKLLKPKTLTHEEFLEFKRFANMNLSDLSFKSGICSIIKLYGINKSKEFKCKLLNLLSCMRLYIAYKSKKYDNVFKIETYWFARTQKGNIQRIGFLTGFEKDFYLNEE